MVLVRDCTIKGNCWVCMMMRRIGGPTEDPGLMNWEERRESITKQRS